MKMEKVGKNGRKVKAYFFAVFCPFIKNGKNAKNGRKVNAIALPLLFFVRL